MSSQGANRRVSIAPASIAWHDGVPESTDFGDVYFSRDNGLEETRYVFLQHNRLDERFRALCDGSQFVIAESGFGTGLNFLAAWQCWRDSNAADGATLHFVSVEKFPLTPDDLKQAHDLWPELADLAQELQANYPELVGGVHRLVLDGGRVRLTLFFGDALDGWQELEFKADAWFLDGFAPSLNPQLWVDDVVSAVQKHSKPGTSVATFTAVGRVRRALIAAGFDMAKVPGYGRKREMLAGTFKGNPTSPTETVPVPDTLLPQPDQQPAKSVIIVGAGVAGTQLAHNLAQRGVRVTVVDSASKPGSGASGNLQGALYVKLGVDYSPQTQLALSALLHAQRSYAPLEHNAWFPSGVLQIAYSEAERLRHQKFLANNDYPRSVLRPVTPEQASKLAGVPVAQSGLWFANSGWLKPARLCEQYLKNRHISFQASYHVHTIDYLDGQWRIADPQGQVLVADELVLCAGHRIQELLPKDQYRFKPIRGQVTLVDEESINPPSCVVCGNRYLNPADQGTCLTGATFDLRDDNPELSAGSQQENIGSLMDMLPGVFKRSPSPDEPLSGRVGFRCTTHDYQPVAGQLGAQDYPGQPAPYLLTGLGSKGLSYAPLLAEYLADVITGQPQALPISISRRLRPERCRNQA
ncbi:bifunctional tRNA (5-methylaminomethyl-2-thiouridine)(34)-methyltransferase MnmD/FAD-dependent 5-carboxymethylaminomethyl-2-thiouridine(34) oxidoreductase MnmC [Marinobacter zhejiangensis]|uniref:tRNA 5-methylaminomethyl-2-thiouridine biosynthesis bifunctional protein MnmC n=1 Tax=Marinobacter zhejiangensis TaxID=488535 RepID=A0A1I4PBX7_9GAMM|nr:bifunctional tRNA (5-methylaminomethyl-2-thiouridine)(34)-methyltransferase MnmD/FAD-dependent 5-carboxymethylaminomethyl-2-thiouridine(34) oxidoreductase MnmC [Marinobacter zhejiangensis]SFM25125.1 tRNA 5-methylaminomethyl-2-thiouridine biosynthesis bifunctional protein [Marinobacter zhejiangensis]